MLETKFCGSLVEVVEYVTNHPEIRRGSVTILSSVGDLDGEIDSVGLAGNSDPLLPLSITGGGLGISTENFRGVCCTILCTLLCFTSGICNELLEGSLGIFGIDMVNELIRLEIGSS